MDKPKRYLDVVTNQWADITEAIEKLVPRDDYLHWSDVPERCPECGIGGDAWWAALKLCRIPQLRAINLRDCSGRPFRFATPVSLGETMHDLDRGQPETDAAEWERFSARGLVQESVTSSQLAGCRVEFEAAKEMLRTGRPPGERDEQMAFNNLQALGFVREHAETPLSPAFILEVHRLLTRGHPDEERGGGRARREEDGVPSPNDWGTPAPPACEIPARLEALCAFANGQEPGFFVHPVIRGIILHFCLAYDRPFLHANGRAARAIFCWALERHGYSLIEVMSLSRVLLRDPPRYRRSFWKVESDDNDLTYFILAQMEAIRAAVQDWKQDVARKRLELKEAARRVQGFGNLNPRQQALLAHAFRRPDATYIIVGHQRSHGVTHQTARDDLFDLVDRELLRVTRERRVYRFRPAVEPVGRIRPARVRRRRAGPSGETDALPTSLL